MRSSSLRRLTHGLLTYGTRSFSETAAQHSPAAKKAGLSAAAKCWHSGANGLDWLLGSVVKRSGD